MDSNAFFQILKDAATLADPSSAALPIPAEKREGAWRVLPLEGSFEIVYEDSRGLWSTRRLDARELKLGPGRTLLGGIDRERGGYRGFRADRMRRLTDPANGQRIETGILDWLLARAEVQRRERAALVRKAARQQRRVGPRAAAA